MTFDGITTRAVVAELQEVLRDGAIKKIGQINAHQLLIQWFAQGKNRKLLLSADPSAPKLYLTQRSFQFPKSPPNFVMLLRKYLQPARLLSITQETMDRCVRFRLQAHNELGDLVERSLICEMMGKYSNIILLDETDTIIDAIHRVTAQQSRFRLVLPRMPYESYPSEKKNILVEEPLLPTSSTKSVKGALLDQWTGFSPTAIQELCFRSRIDGNQPYNTLNASEKQDLLSQVNPWVTKIREAQFAGYYYTDPKELFYPLPLYMHGEPMQRFTSISEAIDYFAMHHGQEDRLQQKRAALLQHLQQQYTKREHTLQALQEDLKETEERESIKEEADLLGAYAHQAKKGDQKLTVPDFFHNMQPRTITLDPKFSPHENMEKRYKRYAKLNTAYKLLLDRIPSLQTECSYIQGLIVQAKLADTEEELLSIRQEAATQGLIKKERKGKKEHTPKPLSPRTYLSQHGFRIVVGRNNAQNEELTLRKAGREDLFFHAKDIPGAHVILFTEGRPIPEEDCYDAAWLAARFSAQGEENAVDVDMTLRKNVFKRKGTKPGMVHYENFSTLRVNPQADLELRTLHSPSEK